MKSLVVKKYGGATLATPAQIKAIAAHIRDESREHRIVTVVSAMGTTTNSLIDLAQQVSRRPHRRELDMLLSVGERTSMALLTMALHDLGIDAISFTGSQAGIITDEDHVNARILDIRPLRVEEALAKNKVVILAGFQGVTQNSKEITTLGRGGTDVTAVAMASALRAQRCEILKDVSGVLTADPRVLAQAKRIDYLNYDQFASMTFWGAKVVHYRAVEIARKTKIPILVKAAEGDSSPGTLVSEGAVMFERHEFLSLNSHEKVLEIHFGDGEPAESLAKFSKYLTSREIALPQILHWSGDNSILVSGPKEILAAITAENGHGPFKLSDRGLCTVTVTSNGSLTTESVQRVLEVLQQRSVRPQMLALDSLSATFLLPAGDRVRAVEALHSLIN